MIRFDQICVFVVFVCLCVRVLFVCLFAKGGEQAWNSDERSRTGTDVLIHVQAP